jgi:hypothetical protein
MSDAAGKTVQNLGYHAHIYYDPEKTRAIAEQVCAAIDQKFRVEIDGFRDGPVGPHPIANVLVVFKPDQFEPPADRGCGRGSQQLCDLARQPGCVAAQHAAPRPRRAAAQRLSLGGAVFKNRFGLYSFTRIGAV